MVQLALLASVLVTACATAPRSSAAPPPAPVPAAPVSASPAPTAPAEPPPPAPPAPPAADEPPPYATLLDTRDLNFDEGLYKITRVISLGSAHTTTTVPATQECLPKMDPLPDPAPGWPGLRCKGKARLDGKDVVWSFRCKSDNVVVEGEGPLVFSGKKFTGTIKVSKETTEDGGVSGVRGLMKITGTFLAACIAQPNQSAD